MLTPSEIDLLQQDLKAVIKVVEQDEIDDARALIAAQGFPSEDFDFTQIADSSSDFPSPVTGTVTLIHKGTGIKKTYVAGHCSDWLMQLEADLKSGVFNLKHS